MSRILVIISGPTAAGKTALSEDIARLVPTEIINGDAAQLYVPLTIGTAKPAWRQSGVPHHLFDVVDCPEPVSAAWYAGQARQAIESAWSNKRIAVVVGGSGFYLRSLLYPLSEQVRQTTEPENVSWQMLNELDPVRAGQIHRNDLYRIKRALSICAHGKASDYAPIFNPPASDLLVVVEAMRDKNELDTFIEQRTAHMLSNGWVSEAKELINTSWEPFILARKFIGYQELFDYIRGKITVLQAQMRIIVKTKQYAKRQRTYLQKLFADLGKQSSQLHIISANLTLSPASLYIKQLLDVLPKQET